MLTPMENNQTAEQLKQKMQTLAQNYKQIRLDKQKFFTADPKKAWSFNSFKTEGEQVQVDKNQLQPNEATYFQNYERLAQAYITQRLKTYANDSSKKAPIYKMTGKILADAALKTYIKYGYDITKVIPVDLAIAQLESEGNLGTNKGNRREGSKKSPFNVGVYNKSDAGFLQQVKDSAEGTEMYYDLMAEDYLSNKTAEDFLTKNPANENGAYYAQTDSGQVHPDYDPRNPRGTLGSYVKAVRNFAAKNGLPLPDGNTLKGERLIDAKGKPLAIQSSGSNPTAPADNKPQTTPAPTENTPKKPTTPQPQPTPKNDKGNPTQSTPESTAPAANLPDGELKTQYEKIVKMASQYQKTTDEKKREQMSFSLGELIGQWGDLWGAADESTRKSATAQNEYVLQTEKMIGSAPTPASQEASTGDSSKDNKENTPKKSSNAISASVGEGGQNNKDDVRKVQNLLNRHGLRPKLDETGELDDRTIKAIKKFQEIKLGTVDGLVEPDKNTWKALLGQKVERVEPAPNATPTDTSQQPANPNNNPAASTTENATQGIANAPGSDFSHPNAGKVSLAYTGKSARPLNDRATKLLKSILAACGITSASITSTKRTFADQSRIMYENYPTYASMAELYGAETANAAFRQGKTREQFTQWLKDRYFKTGKGSKHIPGFAMDVVPGGNRAVFAKKVQELAGKGTGVHKIIPKGVDGEKVDHVEFTFEVTNIKGIQ